jgi:hypothetical protein
MKLCELGSNAFTGDFLVLLLKCQVPVGDMLVRQLKVHSHCFKQRTLLPKA